MSFNSKMTALADQVRTLRNTTGTLTLDQITTDITTTNGEVNEQADLISQIQSALEGKAAGGGVTLPTLTNPASASDILSGKEAINGDGTKITGTIATKTSSNLTASGATVTVPAGYYASQATKSVTTTTQVTPTITVSSAGKITATSNQTEGYVSTGTKTATKQLTTQAAKTITPTKSAQTAVAKDVYTTGAITVGAIPNEYVNTTDATATADKIFKNESAYVNGTKVTGTFTIDSEVNTQEDLLAELQTALNGKIGGGGSGGGDTETCTVSVEGGTHAFYTGIENSVITAKRFPVNNLESSSSFSITDCICNSAVYVYDSSSSTTEIITSTNAELLYREAHSQIFKITDKIATIKIQSSSHSGGTLD